MSVNTICVVVFEAAFWSLIILVLIRTFQRAHYRWCPKCKRKLRMLSLDDMTAILTEHTEANRGEAKLAASIWGMANGPIFLCSHCRAWWSSEATR